MIFGFYCFKDTLLQKRVYWFFRHLTLFRLPTDGRRTRIADHIVLSYCLLRVSKKKTPIEKKITK